MIYLKRPRRGARLKEEVWQSEDGEVLKYSLAYVNPGVCGPDNGRLRATITATITTTGISWETRHHSNSTDTNRWLRDFTRK